jgi:hypothetical protein
MSGGTSRSGATRRERPDLFGSVAALAAVFVAVVVGLMLLQSAATDPSGFAGPERTAAALSVLRPDGPAAAVRITEPGPAAVVDDRTPVVSGTGQSGATVTVTGPEGSVLCSTRVQQGEWSCRSGSPMGDGATGATARQVGVSPTSTDSVSFTVERAATVADFLPLAIIVLSLLFVACLLVIARMRPRALPGAPARRAGPRSAAPMRFAALAVAGALVAAVVFGDLALRTWMAGATASALSLFHSGSFVDADHAAPVVAFGSNEAWYGFQLPDSDALAFSVAPVLFFAGVLAAVDPGRWRRYALAGVVGVSSLIVVEQARQIVAGVVLPVGGTAFVLVQNVIGPIVVFVLMVGALGWLVAVSLTGGAARPQRTPEAAVPVLRTTTSPH